MTDLGRFDGKPVTLTPDAHLDVKTRLLAPFFPRYQVLRDMGPLPVDLRDPLRNLVMTLDKRFLFLRNLKAGCTSVAQLMYYYSMGDFYPRTIHRARKGIHLARYDWSVIKPVYEAGSATLFTFVREPEKRIYSAFTNFFVDEKNLARRKHWDPMIAHGLDPKGDLSRNFDAFLDYVEHSLAIDPDRTDSHFRPQVLNIAYGKVAYDYIGRLERMNDELRVIFEMGGRPDFPPAEVLDQRFNTSAGKTAPLTPAQRRRVRDIFAADFEAFGY